MNVVFLSPHFPPNYDLFCVSLKKLGANVLGIGDLPFQELSDNLKWSLADYYQVQNMENYEEILRACGYFTHRYGKLDRIDSHNEHWLETEARIRTDFNISGIKNNTIDTIKYKSKMKEIYRTAGVPVARGTVVYNYTKAKKFINKVGYPVVAKPDKGVGANNTYKIHNEQELERFFAEKPDVDYMMEEFIVGDIFSFDGLIDCEGKIVFYAVHRNCDGVMEILLDDKHTAYYSLREIPEDLLELSKKTLKAFDIKERFFHLEFFRTQEGGLVAL